MDRWQRKHQDELEWERKKYQDELEHARLQLLLWEEDFQQLRKQRRDANQSFPSRMPENWTGERQIRN